MTSQDTSFQTYVRTVQSYPQQTREEEQELVKQYREQGSESARETLVRAHLRHVVAIALKYRRYGLPVADLVAEGNFGIVHALSKFEADPARASSPTLRIGSARTSSITSSARGAW